MTKRRRRLLRSLIAGWTLVVISACVTANVHVVSTTTLVGDAVIRVGGEAVTLTVLLSADTDPHAFEPTPQDLVDIAQADVVFISGAGLEAGISSILENAVGPVVALSDGLSLLSLDESHTEDDAHEVDPHVWFNPLHVAAWADLIAETLGQIDPESADGYRQRAVEYRGELLDLDLWIADQVEKIPPERRSLVTDHAVFGYFAERYGFNQIGTVFPGFSTLSEPSAREMATLQNTLRALEVPAIFIGLTLPSSLPEQIARDTGTRLVFLYTGALSGPDGPAANYMEMMRYNAEAIVGGLTSAD